jgi:hypothetical protein
MDGDKPQMRERRPQYRIEHGFLNKPSPPQGAGY